MATASWNDEVGGRSNLQEGHVENWRDCGAKLLILPAPTHRQLTAAYDGITHVLRGKLLYEMKYKFRETEIRVLGICLLECLEIQRGVKGAVVE